jgi:hypothetical protein
VNGRLRNLDLVLPENVRTAPLNDFFTDNLHQRKIQFMPGCYSIVELPAAGLPSALAVAEMRRRKPFLHKSFASKEVQNAPQ